MAVEKKIKQKMKKWERMAELIFEVDDKISELHKALDDLYEIREKAFEQLDNYEDYFDIDTNISIGHTTMCQYKGEFLDLVKTLKCEIAFSGNTNYEYSNVVFTVKFVHTGPTSFIDHYADSTIIVRVNLAGNGSGSCYVETPVAQTEWDNISLPIYSFYRPNSDISLTMKYSSYEVVSVSGTATKN